MSEPATTNLSDQTDKLLPALESLFAAVNALAIRLSQARSFRHAAGTLPAGERSVLEVLHKHGPQSVPQVARGRGTSRQNIQILVNRLAAEGCVELSANPAHKRSALIHITEAGAGLLAAAAGSQDKLAQALRPRVSEAEVAAATRFLREVHECLTAEDQPLVRPAQRRWLSPRHNRPVQPKVGLPTPKGLEGPPGPVVPAAAPGSEEQTELPVNLL